MTAEHQRLDEAREPSFDGMSGRNEQERRDHHHLAEEPETDLGRDPREAREDQHRAEKRGRGNQHEAGSGDLGGAVCIARHA